MIQSLRFGEELIPEAGRYHLVVSPTCPWCRRVAIARRILGLTDAIAISESVGTGADGFIFDSGCGFDETLRVRTARELYRRQQDWNPGDSTTVPALVDLTTFKIVANESADLLIDLATQWKQFHKEGAPDLYPASMRDQLADLDQEIHQKVNSKAYPINHSEDPDEVAAAKESIVSYLQKIDLRLQENTYLTGEEVRGSDIRLFTTLEMVATMGPFASSIHGAFADTPGVARYFKQLCSLEGWVSEAEAKVLHLS